MTETSTVINHRCANHPSRDGVGICMSCRKVICEECSTKLDGINTCIHCLQEKIDKTRSRPNRFLGLLNVLVGYFGMLLALVCLCAFFAGFGIWIPDSDGFGFGNKLFANTKFMEKTKQVLVRYETDVGEFPSEKQGFRALSWNIYFPDEEAPAGLKVEEDYWDDFYGSRPKLQGGSPIDSYGTPVKYFREGTSVLIVSAGPDRIFSTNRDALRDVLERSDNRGNGAFDSIAHAGGDDMIIVIR